MVTQSDIEMGQGLHTKVSGGHSEWYRDGTGAPPRSVVVTQSGIEMGHTKVSSGHSEWNRDGTHTKVSGGHSEWNRDGTHQGQWWSLRVV